jgi:purine-binding chemotaxis protein CheW
MTHQVNQTRNLQFATFSVGQLFFGIDVLQVQEVLQYQPMTPVPLAPSVIEGLINLRGQIVTAVDMRRRLGLNDRSGDQMPMNVVVRAGEGAVSLLVDEIGDVVEVSSDTFELPPDNVDPATRRMLRGVYKLKDRLLLILDMERTIDIATAKLPSRSEHGGAETRASQ